MPIWVSHNRTMVLADYCNVFSDDDGTYSFGAYQRLENEQAPYIVVKQLSEQAANELYRQVETAIVRGDRLVEI